MSAEAKNQDADKNPEVCCSENADHDLAQLARGLGHPLRVTIMRKLLEHGDCLCGDLVASLPRAQSTVSQHLKILKETGLVSGEIDGPRVCYCANRKALQRFQELLNSFDTRTPGGCT